MRSYNSAIKTFPTFLVAYRERAALFYFLGKPDNALKDLNMALTIDTIDEATLMDRASFYNVTGNLDLASKDLEKVIKNNHQNYRARANLATIKIKKGNYNDALNDFTVLVAEYPTQPILHNNRADALRRLKMLDEALKEAEIALMLDETFVWGHVNKGLILNDLNRVDEAKKEFDRAIQLGFTQEEIDFLMNEK